LDQEPQERLARIRKPLFLEAQIHRLEGCIILGILTKEGVRWQFFPKQMGGAELGSLMVGRLGNCYD